MRRLVDEVRVRAPGLDVRTAFLDLSEPAVPEVLARLHAEGHREVVVVPLLLGAAFHARVDLPGMLHEVRARLPLLRVLSSEVLGPDPLLDAAALDRLGTQGGGSPDALGVVVAGVGSAHAPANAAVARVAAHWRADFAGVMHAFATCAPDVGSALTRLRAHGVRRFAVVPWFLAPGLLLDRIALHARQVCPEVLIAEPMGAHPLVAELVLRRYAQARATAARAA